MAVLLALGRMLPWYAYLVIGLVLWGSWHRHKGAQADELKREVKAHESRAATVDRIQVATEPAVVAARARADNVRSAAAAGDGLRIRAQSAAASAAGSCEAAADTSRMLADLLGSVEAEGRRLAEIADERGAAGEACQRAFDAMSAPK
jgi:hypothetical protein